MKKQDEENRLMGDFYVRNKEALEKYGLKITRMKDTGEPVLSLVYRAEKNNVIKGIFFFAVRAYCENYTPRHGYLGFQIEIDTLDKNTRDKINCYQDEGKFMSTLTLVMDGKYYD